MIDFELTDLLIELEEIQRERILHLARGREVADLLNFYEIPAHLYALKQEPAAGRPEEQRRRKIALFNFGMVTEDVKPRLIECLFMIGHAPDFIGEALGEDIRVVAQTLRNVVDEMRAQRATELRQNPQRFRLVTNG